MFNNESTAPLEGNHFGMIKPYETYYISPKIANSTVKLNYASTFVTFR